MLEVKNLSFFYGRRKIIGDLSFCLEAGQCMAVAGPNGAGKTTLMSLLAGIYKPTSGEIHAGGRIGYVPQSDGLLDNATAAENLRFFAAAAHRPVPDAASLPFETASFLGKRVSALSGGMKRQLSIACAMCTEPEILLLDEPCSALDIRFRNSVIEQISAWKAEGRIVVYTGHDPNEILPVFDKILFLGNPAAVYSREELGENVSDEHRFSAFFTDMISADRIAGA